MKPGMRVVTPIGPGKVLDGPFSYWDRSVKLKMWAVTMFGPGKEVFVFASSDLLPTHEERVTEALKEINRYYSEEANTDLPEEDPEAMGKQLQDANSLILHVQAILKGKP